MNMLQCDYWLLGTFYLLSPSIVIFMTLCTQTCEFPDNSAVKGLNKPEILAIDSIRNRHELFKYNSMYMYVL